MGIKGFTKFINDRAEMYFENFQLRDCTLIVDGHSTSCQLYNWKHWQFDARSYNCYGGDYDKYAFIVRHFFGMLKEVKVKPIVIFDGGFEQRKLPTILSRMQDKIKIADKLDPIFELQQPNQVVFPLFLREVFKDILRSLDIEIAMCEFEGDTEIANIAKALKCPVLTFDSDYFIFGAQYIPFKTLDSKITTINNWRTGSFKYVSCKIYKIENFLKSFKGLEEHTIHLLPVLLGNDYINCLLFNRFIESINALNVAVQEKILLVLNWLKTETFESAIIKILRTFEDVNERLSILNKIEKIVVAYWFSESKLFKNLNIKKSAAQQSNNIDFQKLKEIIKSESINQDQAIKLPLTESTLSGLKRKENDEADESVNQKIKFEHVSEPNGENELSYSSLLFEIQDTHLEKDNSSKNPVSSLFLKNYSQALYPSSFMDILTQNCYYCIPQVEDYNAENSHVFSFTILEAIHRILTNCEGEEFSIVARDKGTDIKWFKPEKCDVLVPSLSSIEELSLQDRREVLFRILHIDGSFTSVLEKFPTEWHTFLIALKFLWPKTKWTTPLFYSIILCYIILNYIDQRTGFYRSKARYLHKYQAFLQNLPAQEQVHFREDKNCFYYFPTRDCFVFMHKVIGHFSPNSERVQFNKQLIHQMSQIQSVLLHVKYLNSLLKHPYPNLMVHHIINSTFIYNLTCLFQEKYNNQLENNYLNIFFKDCPSILVGLKYVIKVLHKELLLQSL
ncbi:hypothetical protein ABEB36_010230 [Hypothenemus hampei]|uniref:XPG N-terminal domain-containing protein n=1 Tax=Hypothenemus hampei TaxID=57062 RepID=A0ABD1EIZ5_HYPHA